ncbi:phenylacetic acid degradation protein PaaN [Aquisalimonas lutea]|uniref:phenylacetic acid degradation protein PaaN n=1 Tax=Aquisalimonas lutea TaxID=1327750 RepID=UPI0025B528F2|nr:phenylacetic acid degradation protein PaaN [Aquisalimonas lutea]MDN3518197.1 phenylacetic acid degradation protein PaaN [Aquisalimonas lutea]
MSQPYFDKHRETLDKAVEASRTREFWSPYPEAPSGKVYGEDAPAAGEAAFKARLNQPFRLDMPGVDGEIGAERSPYGFDLGIRYPNVDVQQLLPAMEKSLRAWRDAGAHERAGICLEILQRLNKRSFELAHAVMHTTGQAFPMAFQAGGTHAQDRGLEAVAYAYEAMTRHPGQAHWTKPQGKKDPLEMDKSFHVVPRGLALTIGVSTFPTWNGYPGLFASLATGNPVVVKPHPQTILPLAITVEVCQEVLKEAGFDPWIVSLVTDTAEAPVTKELALDPRVQVIDYTGSSAFGEWLEQNCHHAQVYTEKAGVNSIVIDSTDNLKAMCQNLAFSLSLYSGQMCTTPQDIFIPRDGIDTDQGRLSFDEVAEALASGVSKFLADNDRATAVLGAIQAPVTAERIEDAKKLGRVVLDSESREHPQFEGARIRTPLMLAVDAKDEDAYQRELFGPISLLIATDGTRDSIDRARDLARSKGAMTWAVYSTSEQVLDDMREAALDAGVCLSENLLGGVYVNQTAAFSDYHGTGANPAANAVLCDAAFVANRFRVVQTRRHAA